ncbi:MAG TPA: hypothetical protein VF494_00210 [Candidatus Limnocylindrales bacterium]
MSRTLIAVGVTLIVTACTRAAGEPIGTPSEFVRPGAVPSQAPVPESPAPSSVLATLEPLPSDPELRQIVELRRSAGLRSDLDWIAAVAADPRATTYLLAISLLPEEEAEDGTFELPCQAGTWTIEVTVPGDDGWSPIGEGTVEVPANKTVRLDIVLTVEP